MAVAQTPSAALRAKLAALAAVHADWVAQHLDSSPFTPSRKRKSDYNLHYVDLDADDDEFHQRAAAALESATATRAAGMDTHPAGEELKHYWVYGEGRAKWSTYTELHEHLLKHAVPHADAVAASWFHLRYGYWPGSDKNRVAHGKPPRGERVGPG